MSDPTIDTLLEMGLRYIPRPIQRRKEMEHLQTPLTVEPYVGTSPTEADIVDADDEVIASGVQTSTARCFCKAVNCHNDLLAACKSAKIACVNRISALNADLSQASGPTDKAVWKAMIHDYTRLEIKLAAAIKKARETP